MSTGPNPTPNDLAAYFERLAEEQPAQQEWADGARLTRRWIALLDSKAVDQKVVTALIDDIEANPDPGSGWFDLWLRVRHWARNAGFDAPERNPWAK